MPVLSVIGFQDFAFYEVVGGVDYREGTREETTETIGGGEGYSTHVG